MSQVFSMFGEKRSASQAPLIIVVFYGELGFTAAFPKGGRAL